MRVTLPPAATLVAAAMLATGSTLQAQVRHWPRGVYAGVGADGALLHSDETRDLKVVVAPTVALGVALTSRVAVELSLRTAAYPTPAGPSLYVPTGFSLRYTQIAVQPVVALYHSPFASLYGGARISLNRKAGEQTRFFLDPAVAGGMGLGLVGGVRALWVERVGFDFTVSVEGQWFGDLSADGLRVPDTRTNAAWFGLRALLVAFPF